MRCSHEALADSLGLSREWVCTLIGRLSETGWIITHAPRLPDRKQEVTSFKPGPMLKRLLVMLMKSKHRYNKRNVNTSSKQLPSPTDIVKAKAFFAGLRAELAQKLSPPGTKGRGIKPG
jgi:DNA-binding Lrp family transcriptional regulator